ncbi:hypothetical protein HHK36_019168 [Tetracentron sinense]|uniref:Exonuclease V n=1 Tax=Tetracentron sinense TaxID=13715 RepID=A0A834Z0S6_TETSI|nr:hypothetical protein HHK36_019168 [Tetracentron sinense]
MAKSPVKFPKIDIPEIPVEIVSEEEMAFIEAALAATRFSMYSSTIPVASSSSRSSIFSSVSSSQFQRNARSVESISLRFKRRLSGCSETRAVGDIEDSGDLMGTQKKIKVSKSLLQRFRKKRGLSVTDITSSEWCEKQMEFILECGRPISTKAMKAGSARHAKLEEEVIKRVKVRVKSVEDVWAVKLMNFIVGANQLLFEGLTRELPLIGFVEGVWMVGVIDEIRMPVTESVRNPTLVDTKTRSQARLPSEPQRRNGRLQLMCYKYLWDNVVAVNFPLNQFFDFFSLNSQYILSEEIKESTASSGLPTKTLGDLVEYFRNTCCLLPPAHDQLLLRYEFQEDHSLLGEDEFTYDSVWLKKQLQCGLEFWSGEREANYVPEEERWKCQFCKFASMCPSNTTSSQIAQEAINNQ